jgi:hypothetical protein
MITWLLAAPALASRADEMVGRARDDAVRSVVPVSPL